MSAYVSVSVSLPLYVSLTLFPAVCLSFSLSICLCFCLSLALSLWFCLCLCLSVCLSVGLSVSRSLSLSVWEEKVGGGGVEVERLGCLLVCWPPLKIYRDIKSYHCLVQPTWYLFLAQTTTSQSRMTCATGSYGHMTDQRVSQSYRLLSPLCCDCCCCVYAI